MHFLTRDGVSASRGNCLRISAAVGDASHIHKRRGARDV